jgi:hypothetical protein
MNTKLYRPLIKGAVGLLVLWFILIIIKDLPMFQDIYIQSIGLTVIALFEIIISILMILVLWNMGRELTPVLETNLPEWPQSIMFASSIIQLIILIIAYNALEPLAYNFLEEDFLIFKIVFLLLALYPLIRGGKALYDSVDVLMDLISAKSSDTSAK